MAFGKLSLIQFSGKDATDDRIVQTCVTWESENSDCPSSYWTNEEFGCMNIFSADFKVSCFYSFQI